MAIVQLLGCERRDVVDWVVNVRTAPYPRPRCAKGSRHAGVLYPRGAPVSGATLHLLPGGRVSTSRADGTARFPGTRAGAYSLQVAAKGFRERTLQLSPTSSAREVNLQPCIYPGASRAEVGFARRVTLKAINLCGPAWANAALRWSQVEGPDVSRSVSDWRSSALSFTTASLMRARGGLPSKPQLIGFSHDQAGEYVFRLSAVTPEGLRSEGYVLVTSAAVTSGLTSLAPNHTYYFAGPKDGPWRWRLGAKPPGWSVELRDAETRTPALRVIAAANADFRNETVELREEQSQLLFSLMLAPWNAAPRDCGRSECHAAMQGHWASSKHGTSWSRLIEGEPALERGEAAEACASCHSVGYDPYVEDGGYDDLSRSHASAVPLNPHKGAYAALPREVQEVSNVYCVACHGPARLDPPFGTQPGLFQVSVCARCHGRLPEQDNVAQWLASRHARDPSALKGDPSSVPECATCHVAQAFYYERFALGRPLSAQTALTTCCEHPQPIGCQVCHDAMVALHPRQLRSYGRTVSAAGERFPDSGGAAVCVLCHSNGHLARDPSTVRERLAPHAGQTEVLYGRGGFDLPAPGYPAIRGAACAKKTLQSCVTCHMKQAGSEQAPELAFGGHAVRMASEEKQTERDAAGRARRSENIGACRECHASARAFNERARGDYDGDGQVEGVQSEVDGLLALLESDLNAAIASASYRGCDPRGAVGVRFATSARHRIIVVDEQGFDLGDCDRNGAIERDERAFVLPASATALFKAAYNYLLIQTDRSRGLHNVPFSVNLLQRTIVALRGPAWRSSWSIYVASGALR